MKTSSVKQRISTFLRIAVHVGSLIPLVVLGWQYASRNLTVNPIQAAEQRTGDTALVLLLLSLACTPLSILTGFSQITQRRRALGLYAFLYAAVHLLIFTILDYGLDFQLIWQTVAEKPYIIAGTGAFFIILPLAVTSFRWWMKRMGKNWLRLHRLVYLAGVLVVVHFAWVVKGDFFRLTGDVKRPLAFGAVLLVLLALRIPAVRKFIIQRRQQLKRSNSKVIELQP